MISLLLKHGGNPNQLHPLTDKSVFDYFLDFMPEGCNAILDHFIMLNGSSFQGKVKYTLLYKVPSKSTGKNFVTNVYCFYL